MMTIDIGRKLHNRTNAFDVLQTSKEPVALDMGMAPGGFSTIILEKCPKARVRAITPDTWRTRGSVAP
jgi:predicted rRNA methylase YqxC with S4 and FtsJ domains